MVESSNTYHPTHFHPFEDKLFDTVGSLNGLVRRLGVLDDDLGRCGMAASFTVPSQTNVHANLEVKRAAATLVMRKLLDRGKSVSCSDSWQSCSVILTIQPGNNNSYVQPLRVYKCFI